MEQEAYVGDVLSFYLDNQFQENFLQFARQENNIFELAYMFGYKPKASTAAQATIYFYQQLPSLLVSGSYIPDYSYALNINANTTITSTDGTSFIIQDAVDFSISSSQDPTDVTVYSTSGGVPQYFLLQKSRNALSAGISTQTFNFGTSTPFSTVNITDSNILGILDITDSEGNKWYEVDHLGQEMVFDSITNTNIHDPNNITNGDAPYLLRLKKVQRRFSTKLTSPTNLQIQFGSGTAADSDEVITPNPNNVGLGLPFMKDKLTAAYSPVNFLYTDTYGIAPSNTTLTVRYLTGGGVNSNVSANTITNINQNGVKFNNVGLNSTQANYIFSSLYSTNPVAATGGKAGDTSEEIRQNTLSTYGTQLRGVTSDDYLIRALSMPPQFGVVTKAYIEATKLSNVSIGEIPSVLDLYILTLQNYENCDSTDLATGLTFYTKFYPKSFILEAENDTTILANKDEIVNKFVIFEGYKCRFYFTEAEKNQIKKYAKICFWKTNLAENKGIQLSLDSVMYEGIKPIDFEFKENQELANAGIYQCEITIYTSKINYSPQLNR